jgi:hypothetical protein
VPGGDYVEAADGEVLLAREQRAYAVLRRLAEPRAEHGERVTGNLDAHGRRVLVLADDFLFCNASLLVADNAAGLENLLAPGGVTIELAGNTTGLVAANPVESVRRGRLGPALLQLAAFLSLFFVCKGARFGRPVVSGITPRREFSEHVRALGLCYARARAERHALASWGSYAIERMRERYDRQGDGSLSGLAAAVATRTGREIGEVMPLFFAVRDAKAGVPADSGARDLETAARLHELLDEAGGPGGHKRIQSNV